MKQILILLLLIGAFLLTPSMYAGRPVPQNSPASQVSQQSSQPKWLKKAESFLHKKGLVTPLDQNPNKYGTWALIISGIAFLLSFLGIGYLLYPVAIILGIMGLKKDESNTLSIVGIIAGSLGTLFGIALLVLGMLALIYGVPLLVQAFPMLLLIFSYLSIFF